MVTSSRFVTEGYHVKPAQIVQSGDAILAEEFALRAESAAIAADGSADRSEAFAQESEASAVRSETAAGAAEVSETNAAESADDSEASAAASGASAAASAGSAAASAESEVNAKDSENKSKVSETNAKNSENAAKTSETNSANSAAEAQASEDAAYAVYDEFDDRYLGAFAIPPTTDNDGQPLLVGALYFKDTPPSSSMQAWNGTAWQNLPSSGVVIASDVIFTPVGNLSSTNVQTALAELDTEKAAITYVDAQDVTLQADINTRATKTYVDAQDVTLQGNINLKEDKANKGVANGYTPLDGTAKIPSVFLPAYVDDVLEFANLAAFPATGSVGVIYVALDTNRVYRWSGSTYTEISPSPGSTDAVPEGSVNLYYTDSRVMAVMTGPLDGKVDVGGDTMTGPLKMPDGAAGAPALTFANDPDTGMYSGGGNVLRFATGGTQRVSIGTTGIDFSIQLREANGTAANPTYTFTSDADNGMYYIGTDSYGFSVGGTLRWTWTTTLITSTLPIALPADPTTALQAATKQYADTKVAKTADTGAAVTPVGNSAARPGSPVAGYFRFNSQISKFEGYDGVAWGAIGGGATIADSSPANPSVGQLWWESDTGALNVWYDDGNTSQWVQTNGTGIADPAFDGKPYARKDGAWVEAIPKVGDSTINGNLTATTFNVAANFGLAMTASPVLNFDVGDYLSYDRASNVFLFTIGGTARLTVSTTGLGILGNTAWHVGNLPNPAQTTVANNYGANKQTFGSGTTIGGDVISAGGAGIPLGVECSASGGAGAGIGINRATSDGWVMAFYRGGGGVGSIGITASGTSYNATSDVRKKEDLQPWLGVDDFFDRVSVYDFQWKDLDGLRGIGVVAQELYDLEPRAVAVGGSFTRTQEDEDGEPIEVPEERMWGVDYSKLVPHLIAAIQQLRKRVAELEAR